VLDLGMIAGAPVLGYLAFHRGYDSLFRTVGAACFVSGMLYAISSIPVWKARALAADAVS
jgi:1,4-dihydroxy-2-naphthoate octaprenyltransferase